MRSYSYVAPKAGKDAATVAGNSHRARIRGRFPAMNSPQWRIPRSTPKIRKRTCFRVIFNRPSRHASFGRFQFAIKSVPEVGHRGKAAFPFHLHRMLRRSASLRGVRGGKGQGLRFGSHGHNILRFLLACPQYLAVFAENYPRIARYPTFKPSWKHPLPPIHYHGNEFHPASIGPNPGSSSAIGTGGSGRRLQLCPP